MLALAAILFAFGLLSGGARAQSDGSDGGDEPDSMSTFPPEPAPEAAPVYPDELVCTGTCLSAADCLASGRVYELGSCGDGGDSTSVCCKEAPSCYMETFDAPINGTCRGVDWCASQGGHSFESVACGSRGDFACCTTDPGASSATEAVGSSALTPCQVAGLLRGAGFDESVVAKMVCTAKHESGYRCNAVGRTNGDGSVDYGLFQVNSRWWCSGGPRSPGNPGCGISCQAALDCNTAATCAKRIFSSQGIRAWYGYTSFKSECDSYQLPAECRNGGGGAPIQPSNPQPAPPANGGQAIGSSCKFNGQSGKCNDNTKCVQSGGVVKAARIGAVGCEKIPSAQIMCCIPSSQPVAVNAPACSLGGNNGLCLPLAQCVGDKKSVPASQGAVGCGHIKDWNIQCCVVPPKTASVPALSIPGGRSCALARPTGCSAFIGRQMTVNIQFADEMIRVNSHARNAGIKVTVTDSYRVPTVGYGAAQSRHKVGFALDMNANGCNSDCMCYINSIRNAGAKKFLQAVMADSNLHWGADPRNPINWAVGSCSKDSVHIQSREYQAGASYSSVQSCLSQEWNAGRFASFNCASGASLLNDDVEQNEDDVAPPETSETDGLSGGAIAGIVIVVIVIVVAAILGAVFFFKKREAAANGSQFVESNAVDTVPMTSTGTSRGVSNTVSNSSGASFAAGAAGEYACAQCDKIYQYAEDLQKHVAARH